MVKQMFKLEESQMQYKFGDGCRNSLGNLEIRLPTPNGGYLPILADVFKADIPPLLGLNFVRQELILLNYLCNHLEDWTLGWKMPVIDKLGHIFVKWKPSQILYKKASCNSCTCTSFTPLSKSSSIS